MIFNVVSKEKIHQVIIDDGFSHLVEQFSWWIKPTGYVYTQSHGRQNRKSIYLHRIVIGAGCGQEVDHINRDPLDNRRCNLRLCTRSQNNMNKCGVRGVNRFRKGWRARIKKNRKDIHLGLFKTKKAAIEARVHAEKVLFGNFSNHEQT